MAHAQELVLRMKNHIEKILISDQEPAAPAFRRASTEREKGNRI
jgi:hypothetical protein